MRVLRLTTLGLLALAGCSLRFDPGEYEPAPCADDPCTLAVPASDPDAACRQGRVSCPSRACADTGIASENGKACGSGRICLGGRCLACIDAAPCQPAGDAARCHAGAMNCLTGVCEDTGALAAAGTTCGPDQVCDSSGACKVCRGGAACTDGLGACDLGAVSCASGAPVCQRTGNALDGSACAAGKVCAAGACVTCSEGAACQPAASPCHVGASQCSTASCPDGSAWQLDGTSCGTNAVCKDGTCRPCVAGLSCTLSGPGQNRCHKGLTSCATGEQTCADGGELLANGTRCGVDQVCFEGTCGACAQDAACTPPGASCHVGTTACATGQPVCNDTLANAAPGTACGTNKVCNGAGACVDCTAGVACTPTNACHVGLTSCATGVSTCVDQGTDVTAGTECAANQVCSPTGSCIACTEGASCTSNPSALCRNGVNACGTGAAVCLDGANKSAGTPCGSGRVCDGAGACVTCVSGAACTPSNPCHAGLTSCSSGSLACLDQGTNVTPGTSCGANQVCDPAGACIACAAGATCGTNANACKNGVIACGTGAPVCQDGTNKSAGTSCGTNRVCNGTGTCVDCTAGLTCTPANLCHTGLTSCASGSLVCVDQGANVAAGTSCGTNQVCSPTGSCIPCTAGASCSTNPTATCRNGTVACGTGAVVCQDGSNKADGTGCGTNKVCSAGVCLDCVAGSACTPTSPLACRTYSTTCTAGPVCTASGNQPNGTTCGTDQVCNGGSCVGCVAGGACAPSNPCRLGAYSCATGAQVCVAGAPDPAKEGQACGVSPQGTCTAGECVCPAGTTYWQGNCESCPGYSVSPFFGTLTAYVDAGSGIDNACCGRANAAGVLGGSCLTLGVALANIPANGFTVSVVGDASKNAADTETYPIHLGGGVTISGPQNDTVYFPGAPGKDVFRVDVDATEVTLYNLTAGRSLGGQVKSGQRWTGQNRPTTGTRDQLASTLRSPRPATSDGFASCAGRI